MLCLEVIHWLETWWYLHWCCSDQTIIIEVESTWMEMSYADWDVLATFALCTALCHWSSIHTSTILNEVIVLVCYTVAIQLHVIICVLCIVFINYIWEKAQWKINQCKGIELQLSVDVELIKVLANWIVAVSNILLLVLVYHLETSERAISLWSDNEPVVDSTFHVDNWAHSRYEIN